MKNLNLFSMRQNFSVLFNVLLTVQLSIILVINKLDAKKSCFIISLLYAYTCFEDYVLIIRRSKLYYIASGIITLVGGRPVHRLRGDCCPQVERGLQSTGWERTAVHRLREDWSPLSTCAPDGHLKVWWYQMPYNKILTSWWWAHNARNM